MSMGKNIKQELEYEARATRKYLERMPAEQFGWQPHAKSMSLGLLASHVAELPEWTGVLINQDEFVLDMENYQPWIASGPQELVEKFDACLKDACRLLEEVDDARMLAIWRMKVGEQIVLELPRIAVVRSMILSHLIHHRGQLSVYLRLLDIPVPATYGPSADEQND